MRLFLISVLFLTGCVNASFGPLNISHNDGELPKVDLNTGVDECKVKAKVQSGGNDNKVYLECRYRF